MGGLGNQMFQYALGRHLAILNQTELKLDISALQEKNLKENITPREYELGILNIQENFCEQRILKKIIKQPLEFKNLFYLLQRKLSPFKVVTESNYPFNPEVLNVSNNTYLQGYWHSEKYFIEIENLIRKEFQFKYPLDDSNAKLLDKINNSNSISIHIRRSDYITNPDANNHHGVCSIDYYNKSIQLITEKISNPDFFVFSDDMNWVIDHIKINFPITYINHNQGKNSYRDLQLMSCCKHNIIANSSFSWWGAWLNNYKDKIVIAPKKWFNNPNMDTKDLIPENWIKI